MDVPFTINHYGALSMAQVSNPVNITARMSVEAQRLYQWANTYGTSQQKEFATNMLKACAHSVQVFNAAQSPSKPTPAVSSTRSETWLMGEAAGHVYNETGVRPPTPADVNIHEWHAGFFSSAIDPATKGPRL
jgi:hypothetical protein